jgi:N-methylhydantoinase A
MKLSIDMGGTFTDLVADDDGVVSLHKEPTTAAAPVEGILSGIARLAALHSKSQEEFLGGVDTIVHGTTRATNAILTGTVARTAFVTTKGHPDILLFRMGGREDPFRHDREFPPPYVPRWLTFELDERIDYRGEVIRPVNQASLDHVIERIVEAGVEAVGVCLLWSIANGSHERAVRGALAAVAPDLHVTLSHEVNPVIREYHRASSACIDASLKPLMVDYLDTLAGALEVSGFRGRLLVASVSGGLLDPATLAAAPIHSINSGPALAPVAGRHYAGAAVAADTAIVVDTGGTSFDVSVVRHHRVPRTRETWLGDPLVGHITGFPSVDVRTTGAGGGSIARVDSGGLLTVGPASAGSVPGPACFGRGGTLATVTDAAVTLGYLDPARMRDAGIKLDIAAAERVIGEQIGAPLGLDHVGGADAVIRVLTEQMVHAVEEVTIDQGVDPRDAVLISGGGAAGFNVVAIARRLGCRQLVIPDTAAALSAAGGLLSELFSEHAAALVTDTARFDFAAVNDAIERLLGEATAWLQRAGLGDDGEIELLAEARYPGQVWELEVPVAVTWFRTETDVEALRESFHDLHAEVYAVSDRASAVEIVGWRARARAKSPLAAGLSLADRDPEANATDLKSDPVRNTRRVHLRPHGWQDLQVIEGARIDEVRGPAVLELTGTTVLLEPSTVATRSEAAAILVDFAPTAGPTPSPASTQSSEVIRAG